MPSDIEPGRIINNVYFVGCSKACCHLIDTGEGLILIDTGNPHTSENVVDSITKLGFDVADIRYIIHSHGHYDHVGATPEILRLCNAETFLNHNDLCFIDDPFLNPMGDEAKRIEPLKIDHDLCEGDIIELGNTKIEIMYTPGHSMGVVSLFFNTTENGKTYRVGMFGGAGHRQVSYEHLNRWKLPYIQRELFIPSIERLKKEKVDVMLGNHAWNNNTAERLQKAKTQKENPFIDSAAFPNFLEEIKIKVLDILNSGK